MSTPGHAPKEVLDPRRSPEVRGRTFLPRVAATGSTVGETSPSDRTASAESSTERMTAKAKILFLRFRDQATELRTELLTELGPTLPGSAQAEAAANLRVARSVFGKWCIEILVVLFPGDATRFNDLRRALPGITSDSLSRKLRGLEKIGLVERHVGAGRPPSVSYSLTEDGRILARMGEPVFLFLRLRTAPSHR
jgi:DNA-binding HxlR family transcriptional regulator